MTWLARIRTHLTQSRARGVPFDRAWRAALDAHPVERLASRWLCDPDNGMAWSPAEWGRFLSHTERHMRAAYYRDGSVFGRCRFSSLDWSEVERDVRGCEVIA